jgi:hypothetical protein
MAHCNEHSGVIQRLESMNEKLDLMMAQMQSMHHSWHGNGVPGVKERIGKLETGLSAIKWAGMTAGGVGIAILVNALWGVLR